MQIMKKVLDLLMIIINIITQKNERPVKREKIMNTWTGREIRIATNGGGHYTKQADYELNTVKVTIVKETEKAVLVSRFVKSKEKEYTCWLPKSALEFCTSGDPAYDETNTFLKKGFERSFDSYKSWFFCC